MLSVLTTHLSVDRLNNQGGVVNFRPYMRYFFSIEALNEFIHRHIVEVPVARSSLTGGLKFKSNEESGEISH